LIAQTTQTSRKRSRILNTRLRRALKFNSEPLRFVRFVDEIFLGVLRVLLVLRVTEAVNLERIESKNDGGREFGETNPILGQMR
jgi:hypothetical protein